MLDSGEPRTAPSKKETSTLRTAKLSKRLTWREKWEISASMLKTLKSHKKLLLQERIFKTTTIASSQELPKTSLKENKNLILRLLLPKRLSMKWTNKLLPLKIFKNKWMHPHKQPKILLILSDNFCKSQTHNRWCKLVMNVKQQWSN